MARLPHRRPHLPRHLRRRHRRRRGPAPRRLRAARRRRRPDAPRRSLSSRRRHRCGSTSTAPPTRCPATTAAWCAAPDRRSCSSVLVEPGDRVAEGDPLAVRREHEDGDHHHRAVRRHHRRGGSRREHAGRSGRADRPHRDVRRRPGPAGRPRSTSPDWPPPSHGDSPPCEPVYEALRSYLLGYDLDPGSLGAMLTRQRRLSETGCAGRRRPAAVRGRAAGPVRRRQLAVPAAR